ncbi:DNA primase catalytic subunit PriS [Archaeoglobus sp.]|uniref:DNA primase catalytic subunit PriS n=1 Tax=Archaeoglobus sp. TaxID=1872626 RepID=UPI0024AB274F|nr:DNA primase catalytic subunit PriS [Archaeoglobus sp.]MDI3496843.1 primase small subunit [Archaeoglobus sp.]
MLTKLFLKKKFEEYYSKNEVELPRKFKNREFAFVPLESLPDFVMHRHISFRSETDFRAYILSNVPAHIYFSSAYYERPAEDKMENKGWLGADLIFDIDADHLPVKAQSFEKALEMAKREIKKLTAVLRADFGIRDMKIYFSGGRGYHVHVHDEEFLSLGSAERREIVDYLRLNSPKIVVEDRFANSNAAKRVLNYLRKKLEEDERLASKLKIKPADLKKEKLTKKVIRAVEKFDYSALSIHIDAPVTADVKRLIRLPGSLHGKTGLRVTEVEDIESFNPLKDALAFGDEAVVVKVARKLNLSIGDFSGKIYPGRVKLPEYAAVFLICRGDASYDS